jgi:hypothetical protein
MASLTTISETGLTLYFIIRDQDSLVWNTTTLALEAFNGANYPTKYGNAAGEQGTTGYYYGATPATLPVGHYRIDWRSQAGASPAQSDEPIAFGSGYWDGANWLPDWATKIAKAAAPVADSVEADVKATLADTDELQIDWVNGGRLDLLIDAITGYVDCLPASWVIPATVAQVNAEMVDIVSVDARVAGVTIEEALRRIGAKASGTISGAGTGIETIYDWLNSIHTLVCTVDVNGNYTVAHN